MVQIEILNSRFAGLIPDLSKKCHLSDRRRLLSFFYFLFRQKRNSIKSDDFDEKPRFDISATFSDFFRFNCCFAFVEKSRIRERSSGGIIFSRNGKLNILGR